MDNTAASRVVVPRRVFMSGSVQIGDPNPKAAPEEAAKLIAHGRTYLAHAALEGPEIAERGALLIYRFVPPPAKSKG